MKIFRSIRNKEKKSYNFKINFHLPNWVLFKRMPGLGAGFAVGGGGGEPGTAWESMCLLSLFLLSSFLKCLYWSVVALHHCISPATWQSKSAGCVDTPPPWGFFRSPVTAELWAPWAKPQAVLIIYFVHGIGKVYVSITFLKEAIIALRKCHICTLKLIFLNTWT